jgi:hypothetical protein
LVLCVLAISQDVGRADPDGPPQVQGTWNGTFQSSTNPDVTGPVSLVISDQDGHRFTAMFPSGPPQFPTDLSKGTVSSSGEVTVVFKGLGKKGIVHGTVTGSVMTLDYMIHSGGEPSDKGSMGISNGPT